MWRINTKPGWLFRLLFSGLLCLVVVSTASARSAIPRDTLPSKETLPGLPGTTARLLWDSCTLIDYVFFDLPISMSMDQQNSIRAVLRHFGSRPPEMLDPSCKAIGKIYYQVNGNILLNASLYCSDSCAYFVFYEGDVKKYANLMTQDAFKFYQQTIESVKKRE